MKKAAWAIFAVACVLFLGWCYMLYVLYRHAQMVGEVEDELESKDVPIVSLNGKSNEPKKDVEQTETAGSGKGEA